MSRPEVIFLTQTRIGQRDHDRFGCAILDRAGFRPMFWSFAKAFNPRYFEEYREDAVEDSASTTYFGNCDAACRAAASLSRDALLILCMGADPRIAPMLRIAAGRGASLAAISANLLPDPGDAPGLLGLAARLRILGTKWWRFSLADSKRSGPGQALPPARYLLAGGAKATRTRHPLVRQGTEVVKAHALDYDLFLQETRRGPASLTDTAVFLDDAMVNHPEFMIFGSSKVSPDRYYAAMRRLFDSIEDRFGLEVVIAAHPRVNYSLTPECYGPRRIASKKTLELTRSAKLVITQVSTSVNFAILCRKPLLVTTTDEVYRRFAPQILTTAALLRAPLVRADRATRRKLPAAVAVDQEAYRRYQHVFIKEEDSPDKLFWEIVADRLGAP